MSKRPTKKRKKKRLPDVLSRHELAALIGAPSRTSVVGARNRAVLALMGRLGLRVTEVCQLDVRDVRLTADDPYIRVIGKGNKERRAYLGDGVISLLKEWLKVRPSGSRPLFPVILGGRRAWGGVAKPGRAISRRAVADMVRYFALKAGIDRPIHPHTLRHTAATLALRSGENLRQVQEMLGHADLSTTEVYTHVSNVELAKMARRLDPLSDKVD